VLLITCCLAKDDAVGAWVVLCGPRGVIRITWGVIDKAGLNRLLVPHQSPLFPLNQSSSPSPTMPRVTNTYTVPFDPLRNGPGELATAKERFDLQRFVKKRGSRVTPYPSFVNVYWRAEHCVVDSDMFEDLQLADFVDANKMYGGAECQMFDPLLTLPGRAS
jgi:hypothetical protein